MSITRWSRLLHVNNMCIPTPHLSSGPGNNGSNFMWTTVTWAASYSHWGKEGRAYKDKSLLIFSPMETVSFFKKKLFFHFIRTGTHNSPRSELPDILSSRWSENHPGFSNWGWHTYSSQYFLLGWRKKRRYRECLAYCTILEIFILTKWIDL